jgi:N-acetyl sugar amidotransferase
MRYCQRCLYPENAKPTIIFDDDGVCSGCRYHESRSLGQVDWTERWAMFERIADEAKRMARSRGNKHDCIIPVSGGKDSHYQVWLAKEKLGLNPLLVSFNHLFNTPAGRRNLYNLVEKSGCDHVLVSAGLDGVRRISRYMLETVGDLTWHYHAGIRTVPFQAAVQYNIPLIIWGEHGFAELTGIVSLEDFVEFTRWTRKEHDMRGYEPYDLIGKGEIEEKHLAPYVYPSDSQIARTEVRGIYLSNFIPWNAKAQAEQMIKIWDFGSVTFERERTFNLHGKIEDHANDVHDYLKYVKFGYGRATDDASMEIRHGRLSRPEGRRLVSRYDANVPKTLEFYCDFLGISVGKFYDLVERMRDPKIWEKKGAEWLPKRSAADDVEPEDANLPNDFSDYTFSEENRALYFNPDRPPCKTGNPALDQSSPTFQLM